MLRVYAKAKLKLQPQNFSFANIVLVIKKKCTQSTFKYQKARVIL